VHAKALSKTGASKGGKARALSLAPENRSRIARNAVIARWSRQKGIPANLVGRNSGELLRALNQGALPIGKLELNCAVLNDQTRVISFRSFSKFLKVKGSGTHWKKKREGDYVLPEFVSASYLEPFIDNELKGVLQKPVTYIAQNGQEAEGIEATIIPKICDVWVKALNAGGLTEIRRETAERAYKLLSALANVGIISLIDEATGYQKQKDAYQKILEKYIAPEIRPWVKTFDDDFYQQIYRLLGWDWAAYKSTHKNHSQYVGKLTNRIIYEKLAPGILDALQELNPKDTKGNRRIRHHQNLSENYGYIRLIKHLASVTTIMEQYGDGEITQALHKIDSRYPSLTLDYQMSLDFPIATEKIKKLD